MKDKKRSTQKALKQPDEFVTFWARVIEYVMEHKREFIMGAAGVLVLIILLSAGAAYFQKQEEKAAALFAQARSRLTPGNSVDPGTGMSIPTVLDEGEQQEAISDLVVLVADYGSTQGGQQGRLLLGQIYYDRGDVDASLEMYEDFLDEGSAAPEMVAMAWEGAAYAREAKGDYEGAATCYEKLLRMDLSYVKPWALLGLARCYEQAGQPEKALENYRKLLVDYPGHNRAGNVRASIARISQKGAATLQETEGEGTEGKEVLPATGSPGEEGS